jgi:hypothetical protein
MAVMATQKSPAVLKSDQFEPISGYACITKKR